MRAYGALVRASYRTGTSAGLDDPKFLAIEKEVQERGLVTPSNYQEIEQGIVYIGMPLAQIFAALDDLQREEVVTFGNFALSVYRGGVKDWGNWRPRGPHKETVLVCNSKIVGYAVVGRTTFESLSTEAWRAKVRTNFPPNFFERTSSESEKYIQSGRMPPKGPVKEGGASGGWNWLIFKALDQSKPGRTFADEIDQIVQRNGYVSLKRYLEKVC